MLLVPMGKSYLERLLIIARNKMIASNKKRQEHIKLGTLQRAKLKGAHECSKSPHFVKPRFRMQTLTRTDKVIIKDCYHMTTMDEDVCPMKLSPLLSFSSLNLRAPFCNLHLIQIS